MAEYDPLKYANNNGSEDQASPLPCQPPTSLLLLSRLLEPQIAPVTHGTIDVAVSFALAPNDKLVCGANDDGSGGEALSRLEEAVMLANVLLEKANGMIESSGKVIPFTREKV